MGRRRPLGHTAEAITHAGLVYCSGQILLDPVTMKVVEGGIEAQTEQVLKNLVVSLQRVKPLENIGKTSVLFASITRYGTPPASSQERETERMGVRR